MKLQNASFFWRKNTKSQQPNPLGILFASEGICLRSSLLGSSAWSKTLLKSTCHSLLLPQPALSLSNSVSTRPRICFLRARSLATRFCNLDDFILAISHHFYFLETSLWHLSLSQVSIAISQFMTVVGQQSSFHLPKHFFTSILVRAGGWRNLTGHYVCTGELNMSWAILQHWDQLASSWSCLHLNALGFQKTLLTPRLPMGNYPSSITSKLPMGNDPSLLMLPKHPQRLGGCKLVKARSRTGGTLIIHQNKKAPDY